MIEPCVCVLPFTTPLGISFKYEHHATKQCRLYNFVLSYINLRRRHSKIFLNSGHIFLWSRCQKSRYYVILVTRNHLNIFSVFTALSNHTYCSIIRTQTWVSRYAIRVQYPATSANISSDFSNPNAVECCKQRCAPSLHIHRCDWRFHRSGNSRFLAIPSLPFTNETFQIFTLERDSRGMRSRLSDPTFAAPKLTWNKAHAHPKKQPTSYQ